jgi:four helix bundle protein
MVYTAIRSSPEFQKDLRLSGQITAAAVSSMSNISEGFSRRSNKEFVQFLFISKSSTSEVQSESYVALDQNYISQSDFQAIYQQAEKVSKLDSGLITYLLDKERKHKELRQPKEPEKLKKLEKLKKPEKPT